MPAWADAKSHWLHWIDFSQEWVFKSVLKLPARTYSQSHRLHFNDIWVFKCCLETPASTDAKSHWLHFFIFLLNEFSIVSSESTYAHSWIIKLIASFLHSKQSDLSDGVWPSHHLTDVEQPSKTIKYEGIPKNHQQTIEHDGYPQPFHSKVFVALRFENHKKRCQSDIQNNIQNITEKILKKLATRQKRALLCLIFKIWRSRFRKMLIRQNQTWPYINSKIWWSTFVEIPDKIRPGPFLFPKFDWVDFKRC